MNLDQTLSQLTEQILKASSNPNPPDFPNLKIYQYNYQMTHVLQIKYVYSSIEKVMGRQNLFYFARKYLELYPPKAPNLDLYGHQFSEFLGTREIQNEIKSLPYLPDLARLDWMVYTEWSGETETNTPAEVQVAKGCLKLWNAIQNEESIEGIVIDLNQSELVMLHNITYQR